MSLFGKNIRKIRTIKSLSQQAFAELFNLKRGTLGAYEEGRSEPKIETIIKIANYFSIPIGDLLTKDLTVNALSKFKSNLTTSQSLTDQESFPNIPFITPKNSKDYLDYYNKEAYINDMTYLKLPVDPQKKFRAYAVSNLEMSSHNKGLFPKDIVVGEIVPKNAYDKLNNGQLLLVVLNDEFVLRKGYISGNSITLSAVHKKVEDKSFLLDDVNELWCIRFVYYHRLPEFKDHLEEKIAKLEAQFLDMKSKHF